MPDQSLDNQSLDALDILDLYRQKSRLSHAELWLRYFELSGMYGGHELEGVLYGLLVPSTREHDIIALALNERFVELGGDHLVPYLQNDREKLELAEENQFLPGSVGYATYGPGQSYSWPFFALGMGIGGAGNLAQAVTYDTLPLGEVAIHRDERVHATDGEIGRVQGLVIEPVQHHVTHVLLQEGHFWGKKDVAIPISAVARIEGGIAVNLTKAQVQDLPEIDINLQAI
jgi:sporulation protein YlmC with PRC-barrel domain